MNKIVRDDHARQGASGRPVLGVLIGALLLLGLSLAGYMLWVGSESPDAASQDASRQATTGTPSGSSNSNPTDRISPANPAYPVPADRSATGSTNR
jgi:hypothetical protein